MGDVIRLARLDKWRRAPQPRARSTAAASSAAPASPSDVVALVQALLRLRSTRLRLALETNKSALLVKRAEQMANLIVISAPGFGQSRSP
jgi:hypothetical protein